MLALELGVIRNLHIACGSDLAHPYFCFYLACGPHLTNYAFAVCIAYCPHYAENLFCCFQIACRSYLVQSSILLFYLHVAQTLWNLVKLFLHFTCGSYVAKSFPVVFTLQEFYFCCFYISSFAVFTFHMVSSCRILLLLFLYCM